MNGAAYEHNGKKIGSEQFYAIACDPRRSVAVEACAGAGKTWMLVSRIVRALLEGAKPHEILAITFTKKAAGEMRKRLNDWLAQWSRATPQQIAKELALRGLPDADAATCDRLKNLYPQMLAAGRPVQVRTFHSWFAALLGGAPLALLERLGLPARYELLLDDSEAVARLWRRFYLAVADAPQERADYEASVATHGRFMTQKALSAALFKRVEFARADEHGTVESAVKSLAQQFPHFAAADIDGILALPEVRAALVDAARALGAASAPTVSAKGVELEQAVASGDFDGALLALLTKEQTPRKFSDKLRGIEAVRHAQDIALDLLAARCQHEAWLHHQRITRLGRLLLREYAALKREQGWIDMNDVERAALEMLSNPVLSGWIQERLDAQVAHLLIDEFQDTNPLQWQALGNWLQSYVGAGSGAPSVFIVGDPKQSIYRFRRAEPQVFRAAQKFIVDEFQGDRLSCDHTYRNSPDVLKVVNAVFDVAQRGYEFDGFRMHTTQSEEPGSVAALPQIKREARAARRGGADAGRTWRDSLTVPRETPEEELVTLECRQASAWIATQLEAGKSPGDIMVLARKRDKLTEMEEQLRALHIPAQQPEKTDLCEAPEVQDIVALLDVLVTTSHDLSLARALKSPLFGVDDNALVELALLSRGRRGQGAATAWFDLLAAAPDESAAESDVRESAHGVPQARADAGRSAGNVSAGLLAARASLLRWKAWVDTLPPHDALEAIYRDGDVPARFAQAAPAALRDVTLANLRALLGAALEVQGGRYLTPYAFVRALKAGGIEGPAVAAEGVVRLLTVHGAKGLEAPVVLMLDADGSPPAAETMGVLCEWPGEAPAPWRFAFIASESRPPACCGDFLRTEQEARQREELNGLYVALTRAERHLVISSVEPYRRVATTWWDRLEPLAEPLDAPLLPLVALSLTDAALVLPVLPELPAESVQAAQAAQAAQSAPELPVGETATTAAQDSDEARFGSAVHRLLEFALHADAGLTPARLRRVTREFSLDAAERERAVSMATRILSGEGAWAWDGSVVDWQGNEVALFHQGELLRIDRLVRHAGTGEWWVLDYKSNAAPERQPLLRAQMQRYRAALLAAEPGRAVRTAFLTGSGRLVEVE